MRTSAAAAGAGATTVYVNAGAIQRGQQRVHTGVTTPQEITAQRTALQVVDTVAAATTATAADVVVATVRVRMRCCSI